MSADFELRPPRLDDVLPYASFLADPEVTVWLDDMSQLPLSTGRIESILLREAWCLWSVEADGILIGVTSLYEPDMARQAARLSIVIGDRRYWGHGIGTAVVGQVLNAAFDRLGLRKVTSDYLEPNTAAARLHERTGFTVEGRLREDAWRDGRWVDRITVSKLAREHSGRGSAS